MLIQTYLKSALTGFFDHFFVIGNCFGVTSYDLSKSRLEPFQKGRDFMPDAIAEVDRALIALIVNGRNAVFLTVGKDLSLWNIQ